MSTRYIRPLYDFAYFPDFDKSLGELRALAEDEPGDWNYVSDEYKDPRHTYPILYNYLHYTFVRLEEEGKTEESGDGTEACFNTGLVTEHQEPIFAFFEASRVKGEDKSPWFFKKFVRKGEHTLSSFSQLPSLAHYFEDPSELIYDPRLELRINVEHIIGDHKERFPDSFKALPEYQLQNIVRGAIETAQQRVRRNYKTAVPQYYRGRIQLLLPLCLADPGKADLAVVVERFEGFYRASTCLPLDYAYNNARLLASPDRDWLEP